MDPWVEYLAALEANVEHGWATLAAGADGVDLAVATIEVTVPEGSGQCPGYLRERGTEVLRRISELEQAIITRQESLARELQRRPTLPPAPARVGWGLSIRM